MHDADLIRLHARLRKTANEHVLDPTVGHVVGQNLRTFMPSLAGAAIGLGVAKPGDEPLSALLGATGAAAMNRLGGGAQALGAMAPPVALALYRHFTTPDPTQVPQGHGYPYPG